MATKRVEDRNLHHIVHHTRFAIDKIARSYLEPGLFP